MPPLQKVARMPVCKACDWLITVVARVTAAVENEVSICARSDGSLRPSSCRKGGKAGAKSAKRLCAGQAGELRGWLPSSVVRLAAPPDRPPEHSSAPTTLAAIGHRPDAERNILSYSSFDNLVSALCSPLSPHAYDARSVSLVGR